MFHASSIPLPLPSFLLSLSLSLQVLEVEGVFDDGLALLVFEVKTVVVQVESLRDGD